MYDVLTDFLPCLLPFFLIEKNEDLRTSKCVHYTLLTMKTVVLVLVHLHTFLLDFFETYSKMAARMPLFLILMLVIARFSRIVSAKFRRCFT